MEIQLGSPDDPCPDAQPVQCTYIIVLKLLDQTTAGDVIVVLRQKPATMQGLQNFKPQKMRRECTWRCINARSTDICSSSQCCSSTTDSDSSANAIN